MSALQFHDGEAHAVFLNCIAAMMRELPASRCQGVYSYVRSSSYFWASENGRIMCKTACNSHFLGPTMKRPLGFPSTGQNVVKCPTSFCVLVPHCIQVPDFCPCLSNILGLPVTPWAFLAHALLSLYRNIWRWAVSAAFVYNTGRGKAC